MKTGKSIDDRMKEYENASNFVLTNRLPMILRVDGKCFHTLLKGANKPFDKNVIKAMQQTAQKLCEEIPGTKLAYIQSDEISLVIRDDMSLVTQPWMSKRIQKICSLSASIASVTFSNVYGKDAYFDARCFILPEYEVINYFIWRQQDATRNAIQMVGQANFSQKQLHKLSCDKIQEKLFTDNGINFNSFSTVEKRGTCIIKHNYIHSLSNTNRLYWIIDGNIPVFSKNKEYIQKHYNGENNEI